MVRYMRTFKASEEYTVKKYLQSNILVYASLTEETPHPNKRRCPSAKYTPDSFSLDSLNRHPRQPRLFYIFSIFKLF